MRLQRRHRLLLGALVLAVTIWLLDRLSGRTGPQPAQAKGNGTAPAPTTSLAWDDADALLRRLAALRADGDERRLPETARDPFQPSALLAQLLPATEVPMPSGAESPPADTPGNFGARHRLAGVVLGAEPLAVVDDVVVGLGAVLDGHTLVAVERDAVVFEETATGVRVRLTLPGPGVP